MDFHNSQPIFMQIADYVCNQILEGSLQEEDRIPSVRELAVTLQVNPNTAMRAFEQLTQWGLIYNKRGLGYFIETGAQNKVLQVRKDTFFNETLPRIAEEIKLLNISKEEILQKIF